MSGAGGLAPRSGWSPGFSRSGFRRQGGTPAGNLRSVRGRGRGTRPAWSAVPLIRPFGPPPPAGEGRGRASRRAAALLPPPLGDRLGQGLALDELHGVVVDAALAADRIDRDDVRVVELGGGQGLGLEPAELGRVHRRGERQDLQGHAAIERTLDRLVHHAHAAPADLGRIAEVAQVAEARLAFLRFDRLRIADQRWRGQRRLADELQAGQARLQVLGHLGMIGQQLLPRGCKTLLGCGQVGVQHLDQPGLARGFRLLWVSRLVGDICPLSVVRDRGLPFSYEPDAPSMLAFLIRARRASECMAFLIRPTRQRGLGSRRISLAGHRLRSAS